MTWDRVVVFGKVLVSYFLIKVTSDIEINLSMCTHIWKQSAKYIDSRKEQILEKQIFKYWLYAIVCPIKGGILKLVNL